MLCQRTVETFKQNVAKKIEDDPQKAQNDETRPHGVDCMQISRESVIDLLATKRN